MTVKREPSPAGASSANLKFYRHPYYTARYAALDATHVRVETESGEWGEFTRNGVWIGGPLRHADPIYCRWVTGEIILRENLLRAKEM